MSALVDSLLPALTLGTALGCGLVAGVFFAFSSFVMPALGRLPAAQGVAAMQSINVTVITPSFLAAFVGTGLGCLALIAASLAAPRAGTPLIVAGALLYLLGTLLVTRACNIPLNDALAAADPASADAARLWATFLTKWVAWNHVRTVAALGAAALLTLARR